MELSKHISSREPVLAARLIYAGQVGDLEAIDEITDELAALGVVRPRDDTSMFRVNDPLPKNKWASYGGKNGGANEAP